jgi:hypothetical protein
VEIQNAHSMITIYLDQKETSWYRRKYQLTDEEYQSYLDKGFTHEDLVGYLYSFMEPYDEGTIDSSIENMDPGDNGGEATLELILEDNGEETILYKNA